MDKFEQQVIKEERKKTADLLADKNQKIEDLTNALKRIASMGENGSMAYTLAEIARVALGVNEPGESVVKSNHLAYNKKWAVFFSRQSEVNDIFRVLNKWTGEENLLYFPRSMGMTAEDILGDLK